MAKRTPTAVAAAALRWIMDDGKPTPARCEPHADHIALFDGRERVALHALCMVILLQLLRRLIGERTVRRKAEREIKAVLVRLPLVVQRPRNG